MWRGSLRPQRLLPQCGTTHTHTRSALHSCEFLHCIDHNILVYDLQNLKILPDELAYDFPGGEWRRISRAAGYDYTIVNGEITFEGLRCTGACPGKLLRHGRAQ